MSLHPPFCSTFTDNKNPKRNVRSEIRPKKIRVSFLDLKKYVTDLLTPKNPAQACKFSTQKNTSDPPPPPPVMYSSSTPHGGTDQSLLLGVGQRIQKNCKTKKFLLHCKMHFPRCQEIKYSKLMKELEREAPIL